MFWSSWVFFYYVLYCMTFAASPVSPQYAVHFTASQDPQQPFKGPCQIPSKLYLDLLIILISLR